MTALLPELAPCTSSPSVRPLEQLARVFMSVPRWEQGSFFEATTRSASRCADFTKSNLDDALGLARRLEAVLEGLTPEVLHAAKAVVHETRLNLERAGGK